MGLEIINVLKKEKGLTNEELSKLSGVPKGTLDKITAGTTKDPKLETLKSIAKVLNCSLNDFADEKKAPAPAKAEAGKSAEYIYNRLYTILSENGMLKDGQDITDSQRVILEVICELVINHF